MPLQSVNQVATLLDMSERQVHALAKAGTIPRAQRGGYDLVACVRAYINHLREIAAGRASRDGRHDIVEERARLAKEMADGQALKNAQLRGELVHADDMETSQVTIHSAVQRRILAVPTTVAQLVAIEDDPRICEAIVREYLEEALLDIADAELEVTYPADAEAQDN